jgi:O-antigen ligase
MVGCIVCLANGIFLYLSSGETNHLYSYPLVVLKDMHPAVLGLCCLLSLSFLLEEINSSLIGSNSRTKFLCWAAIFFFVIFLFLIGNRNNLICLHLVLIYYIFRMWRNPVQRVTGVSVLVSVSLIAACYLPSINQRWKEIVDEQSFYRSGNPQDPRAFPDSKTARLRIWSSGWEIVKSNWPFGVGTGDSQSALQSSYTKKNYVFAIFNNCDAHNQYLEETIAFGLPGLFIFLLCLVLPFGYVLYSKDHSLYLVFLLLFAVICLSESILQLNKGIIWYSFFNSLFAFGGSTDNYKK